jgi:hypothetical protein
MVFTTAGGGATQETGYEISNSLRFEGSAATGLARFGNNSRNGNTFTISAWIKRAKLGRTELFNSKVEDSGVNSFFMQFNSDDKLSVIGQPASGTGAGGNRTVALTSAVYRDLSAWYHVVYRQDTTDGTAGNRHRIYVNGVEQTLGTNDALDQNVAFAYFYNASSYPFAIANDERDNTYGSFYIAEHHYTDGVSNGPDAFGETNDNGVWIPKQYTGSHGSYGHYLKFEQSGGGSGTTTIGGHDYSTGSSSTIGADSSGNDNHFHVQGYSAEDNTTDTPTNNFATLNSLANFGSATLSEGNTKNVTPSPAGNGLLPATMGVKSGKWYWEVNVSTTNFVACGIIADDRIHGQVTGLTKADSLTRVVKGDDGKKYSSNSDGGSYMAAYEGSILQVALNLDDGEITFGAGGNWANGSGATNQTFANSTPAYTDLNSSSDFTNKFILPAIADENQGTSDTMEVNFGNPSFSISSGNSDANGYGNFEYAVPSGYYALCTKNLAEYG